MKKDKNEVKEEPILITFDDVPYRASDLEPNQQALAVDLNDIVREMNNLELRHARLTREKNHAINDFKRSLEVETQEDAQPEESK